MVHSRDSDVQVLAGNAIDSAEFNVYLLEVGQGRSGPVSIDVDQGAGYPLDSRFTPHGMSLCLHEEVEPGIYDGSNLYAEFERTSVVDQSPALPTFGSGS